MRSDNYAAPDMAARSGFLWKEATQGPRSYINGNNRRGDPMHVTGRQSKAIQKSKATQNRTLRCGIGSSLCLWAFAFGVWAYAPATWAQADPALPSITADQVVQRLMEKNQERAAAMQHYLGRRSYPLEYHGFPASTEATM